jgi:TolA-binding protein
VETLKPQYIPGQAMISPGASSCSPNTVEEKLNNLQNQQEFENLKSEIRDLQEKIETLKGIIIYILRIMLGIQYTIISFSILGVKSKVIFFGNH